MALGKWRCEWCSRVNAGSYNELYLFGTGKCCRFDGGIVMRTAISLMGAFLFLATSAFAQGPAGVGSEGGYMSEGAHQDNKWAIAIGYQYNRDNLLGSPFNTHGMNVSATRYFGRWLGAEAQLGTGFLGNTGQTSTPPNLQVKSTFIGAGPRLAWRTLGRYEPWAHLVV